MTSDRFEAAASGRIEGAERAGGGGAPPPLRIGISTRALFDLEAEHALFESRGVEAYVRAQRGLEDAPMEKGPAYEAVARLLDLNIPGRHPAVEVVLLSRNAPYASLRTFASIERCKLDIRTGSFTSGGPIAPLLSAWGIDLFLSNEAIDVEAAHASGIAAAKFGAWPRERADLDPSGELRIAFDGDAVLFSDESDAVFEREGLHAFLRHERAKALTPLSPGPFGGILRKLAALRDACKRGGFERRLRIALVTARSAPAHARVVHTFRAWGAEVDEAHFVGDGAKAPVLAAFGAHIFFDDQERHVRAASAFVTSACVPGRSGLPQTTRHEESAARSSCRGSSGATRS